MTENPKMAAVPVPASQKLAVELVADLVAASTGPALAAGRALSRPGATQPGLHSMGEDLLALALVALHGGLRVAAAAIAEAHAEAE